MKYSSEMEVFALKSLLEFLKNCGVKLSVLATDRSTSVRSMMSIDYPEISHQFDVWYGSDTCSKYFYFVFLIW